MMCKLLSIVAIATILLIGCDHRKDITAQKGDIIPANFVCMNSNMFSNKKRLKVPIDEKIYYVCCRNCKKRIIADIDARYATEPLTSQKVDKATAHIVLLGDDRKVSYFENETNHKSYISKN